MRAHFFFLLIGILLTAGSSAYAEKALRVQVHPGEVKQGETCLIRASSPAALTFIEGEFRGIRIPLVSGKRIRTYEGLLGIDLDTPPGRYEIRVRGRGEGEKTYADTHRLGVKKGDFKIQKLTLPSSMVDLDVKTLERVNQEEERLKTLFQEFRDEKLWNGAFLPPVQGEVTTAFGLRRIINRQAKTPHSGVDLGADEGTPVKATNGGVAVLVDDLFFSGKSVILDHGLGIYSMYFHLSQAVIREGDRIDKGAILGFVGSTGRSTGPHLHWGIRIKGARVDPFSLIRITKYMSE